MIIDSWMIPATAETVERWMADPRYRHGFRTVFGADAITPRTPAEMVAEMDSAGVDRAVLTSMADLHGEIATAEQVSEICEQYPDRFLGSFCYDPFRVMASLNHLESLLGAGRFGSAIVLPWAFDIPPDDARWYPLYSFAERADIPVTIQVGHTAPLFRSSLGRPMLVEDVALAFPELRIVLGHLGWPWVDEVIALVGKYPNLYVDTSAYSPSRIPPALLDFMQSTKGSAKVLFGSDYPALALDRLVSSAMRLPIPQACLDRYLGRNALNVFTWGG